MKKETLEIRKKKVRIIVRELKKLFPHARAALHYSNHWELLVAVILSAQCTDKKVNEVTARLFQKYKRLDDYVNARLNEFEQDIKPTGFYKNKAKNILAAARMVKEKYRRALPKTMEEMIALPGVGRKTANVVLGNAYGIVEGIAVDTHVRRLSRFFGLTDHNDPDKIEQDLMQILPRSEWFDFTYRMIEYGRHYQPARKKDLGELPLTRALRKFMPAPYHGIIIDRAFLDSTYVNTFTRLGSKKSRSKGWTLYKVEIPEEQITDVISRVQEKMKGEKYYVHFYKEHSLVVVYKDKVFRINPDNKSTWKKCIDYGMSVGISRDELDFFPCRFEDETY